MGSIIEQIEKSRIELLDLSIRGNSLLHLRQSSKNLEIIDEFSEEIYTILVEKNKIMSFRALPETSIENFENSEPLPITLENMYGKSRHTDSFLQTQLSQDELDKRLLKIHSEAKLYESEQGINILFLSLGFIKWFEDTAPESPRMAPLVLIPINLYRGSAKENFVISYTGEDLGENLTLYYKFKNDFDITLKKFDEDFDYKKYVNNIKKDIEIKEKWVVLENAISIGFFAFGKFQMYQDLHPMNWVSCNNPIEENELIKSLLQDGFINECNQDANTLISSREKFQQINLYDLNFVLDADSSQTEAILAVKEGKSLVIQGPPGTGKSQTITNIIAECLFHKKTVLFVSEKMAALEVVKSRLDNCEIGDLALELHSHKSNKKIVLEELRKTLELNKPITFDRTYEYVQYQQIIDELDLHSNAINGTVLNSELSYIDILGHYLALEEELKEINFPTLNLNEHLYITHHEYLSICNEIEHLVVLLNTLGIPAKNEFTTSKATEFSPTLSADIYALLNLLQSNIYNIKKVSTKIEEQLNMPHSNTIKEVDIFLKSILKAKEAPKLAGVVVDTKEWQSSNNEINTLLANLKIIQELREKRDNQFIEQAWQSEDILSIRANWIVHGKKWYGFFFRNFRESKKKLLGFMEKGNIPKSYDDVINIMDDILKYQNAKKEYEKHSFLGEKLFNSQWKGLKSDCLTLKNIFDWIIELHEDIDNKILPYIATKIVDAHKILEILNIEIEQLLQEVNNFKVNCCDLIQKLQFDKGINFEDYEFNSLKNRFDSFKNNLESMYLIARYNTIVNSLSNRNLQNLAHISFTWEKNPDLLLKYFKFSWFKVLLDNAYSSHDSIKKFDRRRHELLIKQFKDLDTKLFKYAREKLSKIHHDGLPKTSTIGEVAILRKEINNPNC